jgi:hypothetical protein
MTIQSYKETAKILFNKHEGELDRKKAAQIFAALFIINQSMSDSKKKQVFEWELLQAIQKASDADAELLNNYLAPEGEEITQLYQNASDIIDGQWQDSGNYTKILAFFLAFGQALGCLVAVNDSAKTSYNENFAKGIASANFIANFYFIISSLPNIMSNMCFDMVQFNRVRRSLERKKTFELAAKTLAIATSGTLSAMIDTSFVVSSRKSFHNYALAYGVAVATFIAMVGVYIDSFYDLVKQLPESREESSKLLSEVKSTISNYKRTDIPLTITSAITCSAAMYSSWAFADSAESTFSDYGFPKPCSVTTSALAFIPYSCLTLFSLLAAQKFFINLFSSLCRKPENYNLQIDTDTERQPLEDHVQTSPGSDDRSFSCKDFANIIKFGSLILFFASAAGNSSLLRQQGLLAVLCALAVSFATTARSIFAEVKTPGEDFIQSIKMTGSGLSQMITNLSSADNQKPMSGDATKKKPNNVIQLSGISNGEPVGHAHV